MRETTEQAAPSDVMVREFRQILIWPLQIVQNDDATLASHWEHLCMPGAASQWKELDDEFPDDPRAFQERHYREFVAFLPHAQRFLYGERASRSGRTGYGESPIRVFRREDVKQVRLFFHGDVTPQILDIAHCDLYLFYDVDVVMLALEVRATDISLRRAQEIMNRFGRAYPGGWDEDGKPANCVARAEWLDGNGFVLAASDYDNRGKFMASVCTHQAATISAHWQFLLEPLILDQRDRTGPLRYRQLEYYRMPLMAYLAVDDPTVLTRAETVRLAFASPPGQSLPMSERYLANFEERYVYDRFYDPDRSDDHANTRVLCCGQAFVAIGEAGQTIFTDGERGFLAQFRHQMFFLSLVAHFHRAALLMLSDRLVSAMSRLDISNPEAVQKFRRDIRLTHEQFLRFNHRYYFTDISDQQMLSDLFRMVNGHLGTARLYAELREEISDMSAYLESDMLRRQGVTIVRLTVVTLFSLIGTFVTSFLGMNLFNMAEFEPWVKAVAFLAVLAPTTALVLYSVAKSRPLSAFLDSIADEKVGWRDRVTALADVWRERPKFRRPIGGHGIGDIKD